MATVATANAVISPPGGHGSSPVTELGAMYAMVTAELAYDVAGQLSTSIGYRKYGLVLNPQSHGSTILYNSLFATLTTNLTITGVSGSFAGNDIVVGQTSGATATIVDFASGTGLLRLIEITGGPFILDEIVLDQSTAATGEISVIDDPQVQSNTGTILFTENIEAVDRASTQIESIKITIPF